jgi:hypothetical protein
MMTNKALPDGIFSAGDCCGPLVVEVRTAGGRGGDPAYAGGWITGHTGHRGSMMSAAQMRRLAAALCAAAQAIEDAGLPSYEQTRGR